MSARGRIGLGQAEQPGSWEEAPSGKEVVAVLADECLWIQRSPVPAGAVEGGGWRENLSSLGAEGYPYSTSLGKGKTAAPPVAVGAGQEETGPVLTDLPLGPGSVPGVGVGWEGWSCTLYLRSPPGAPGLIASILLHQPCPRAP